MKRRTARPPALLVPGLDRRMLCYAGGFYGWSTEEVCPPGVCLSSGERQQVLQSVLWGRQGHDGNILQLRSRRLLAV